MPEDVPPIELVPKLDVVTPRLPGFVVLRPDADAVVDALLADLAIHSRNCVRTFGDFHFAISATEEAEPYLRRLMYDPSHRDFPWNRTRVWMVDEDGSRYERLHDLVVEQSGIPAEQVHRLSPADVEAYEAELRQHLGWREKGHDRLDFVLLTLQDAGRVGIVPGEGLVKAAGQGAAMTSEFVNASRVVAVIAAGQRERLASLRGQKDLPAQLLSPLAGELRWYVDHAACQPRER